MRRASTDSSGLGSVLCNASGSSGGGCVRAAQRVDFLIDREQRALLALGKQASIMIVAEHGEEIVHEQPFALTQRSDDCCEVVKPSRHGQRLDYKLRVEKCYLAKHVRNRNCKHNAHQQTGNTNKHTRLPIMLPSMPLMITAAHKPLTCCSLA